MDRLSPHPSPQEELSAAVRQPGAGVGAGIALAALSRDGSLLDTLDQVVTSDHAINIVASETSLADQILSSRCGVALIDAEAVVEPLAELATRLRAQFPELVLIIAGRDNHQADVAGLISSGTVYRFLHKPVSSQRVRQFVDAAMRRHDEVHADIDRMPAPAPSQQAETRTRRGGTRPMLPFAIAAVLLAAVVLGFIYLRRAPVAADGTGARLAAPAASVAPPTPGDRKLETLLGGAEQALVKGKLAEAATLLESARALEPDNIRVAFLSTQLGKERERLLLSRARAAAASGDYGQALAVLDGSSGANGGSTTVVETRRNLEHQQLDERVRTLLKLGNERLASGAIVEPEGDNAIFQLEAARTLAPRDPGLLRLEQAVDQRILGEARTAATRGDAASSARWLKLAGERRLPPAEIDAVRTVLANSESRARATEIARLTANFNEQLGRSKSDDKGTDGARAALLALRSYEGNGSNTLEAQGRLVDVLLARSRSALNAGRLDDAQRALTEAQSLGGSSDAAQNLAANIGAERERQRTLNDIVPASKLKRLKSPEPLYPREAYAKSQNGWVELVFLIRTDGSVTDPRVVAAEPAGVFDKAALQSIVRWQFEPVQRDGRPVEQHARLRIRFAIDSR